MAAAIRIGVLFMLFIDYINCLKLFETIRNTNVNYDVLLPGEKVKTNFPGTKWCGAGNIAASYDDLGDERATDICCRDHDYCDTLLRPYQNKYSLNNKSPFTRFSCECDYQFYQCLKAAKSLVADTVGTLYFDVVSGPCFKEDYPIVGCLKKGGRFKKKCLEYNQDMSRTKQYDFYDVPSYMFGKVKKEYTYIVDSSVRPVVEIYP